MRALVVVNPRATAMRRRERDVVAHALGGYASELEIAETSNRGHAAALACRAMRSKYDVVIALGGDGTVNEVINGLLTDGVHAAVPALGIVPAGSTNVFARAVGLPNDPVEATGELLDGLRDSTRKSVSLGLADDRYFCFAAGLGFDAAVVHAVERERRLGKRSTHVLYGQVAVREFLRMDRRRPQLHVDLGRGAAPPDPAFFVIVANADPWTYVGRRALRPTPQVSLESGLAVYSRRRMSAAGVLFSMARMAGERPQVGTRGADVTHDVQCLTVRCDEPTALQVDGDAVGKRSKVTFRSVPDALSVVVSPAR